MTSDQDEIPELELEFDKKPPKWVHLVLIVALSAILVAAVPYILQDMTILNIEESLLSISAAGSVSLSGILAYLYYKSNQTASQQADIHSNQVRIINEQMKIQRSSLLARPIVHRWSANCNQIQLIASNIGKGAASNFGYLLYVSNVNDVDDYEFESLERKFQHHHRFKRDDSENANDVTINAEESQIGFESSPTLCRKYWTSDEEPDAMVEFESVIEYISHSQPDYIHIELCIGYETLLDTTEIEPVWSAIMNYEDEGSLEELLNKKPTRKKRDDDLLPPMCAPEEVKNSQGYIIR